MKKILSLFIAVLMTAVSLVGAVTVSAAAADGSTLTFDLSDYRDATVMFRNDPYDITLSEGDDGSTRFTATANQSDGHDPYIVFMNPQSPTVDKLFVTGVEASYILVRYKTTADSQAEPFIEFYSNIGDGVMWGHSDSHATAPLENDGEWHYVVVNALASFGKHNSSLQAFRIDPLGEAVAGESIDISTVMLFPHADAVWSYLTELSDTDEAAADYVTNHEKPGGPATSEREFAPVGDVSIHWIADKVEDICFDGELDEWDDLGISPVIIDKNNLLVWHANNNVVYDNPDVFDEGFEIKAYFAADAKYLYVALTVVDDAFALADNTYGYNGDAFQIGIDWNRRIEDALEGGTDYSNNKNIFYSFSCLEENAPLWVTVEEGFKHRAISEATSENQYRPDMKGSAGATDNGWGAELCLSWELLYDDYAYKTWESPVDAFNDENPLVLGMTLCYINRSETAYIVEWAAGTFDHSDGYPQSLPSENGIYATLEYEAGREIDCSGIANGDVGHTHKYGEWRVVSLATCVQMGTRTRSCSCGISDIASIPKLGHSFGAWGVVSQQSCTEDGVSIRTCSTCRETETRTEEATGHSFDEMNIISEGSCTEDMEVEWICICGETQMETVEAVGHFYGLEGDGWQTTVEATCAQDGIRTRMCLLCENADVEVIPALGHDFGEWVEIAEDTKIRVCRCGTTEKAPIVTVETDTGVETETTEVLPENDTTAVATTTQLTETTNGTDQKTGGCQSAVGTAGVVVLMAALAMAAIVRKRKIE